MTWSYKHKISIKQLLDIRDQDHNNIVTFTIFLPDNYKAIKPPPTGGLEIPYILWMGNAEIK